MIEYVVPILIFLAVGALAGILLTVAAKFLAVKSDDKVESILSCLPGANCGGCGFSGCEGYAAAVAEGKAEPNLCKPGGMDTAKGISAVLGVEVGEIIPEVAYVRCHGDCNATADKYAYAGTQSCLAAEKFYNGKGLCRSGCAGLGDCVKVCDKNAISIIDGVAVVDPSKCGACGKCVRTCPNHLITLRKVTQGVIVRCSSADIGKDTKAACKNGCLGCKICEKKCSSDAIHIINNHAEIDAEKCTSCGVCASVCPVKCIEIVSKC